MLRVSYWAHPQHRVLALATLLQFEGSLSSNWWFNMGNGMGIVFIRLIVIVIIAVTNTSIAIANSDERNEESPLQLVPERRIDFSTNEGTWMSLDVSPDGSNIVFDLLGDLYLLPIDGGVARALTNGMSFDAQPRFSPDGNRIVYLSDQSGAENVWVLDVTDSSKTQLTFGSGRNYLSPEWSPNGQSIFVSARETLRFLDPMKVSRIRLDTLDFEELTLPDIRGNQYIAGLSFGEGPERMWYAFRTAGLSQNLSLPVWQVGFTDFEDRSSHVVTSVQGSAFRPTLSPDGRWLVYGTRYGIETGFRIRDLSTGQDDWLAYPVQFDAQESIASMDVLPGYSFTPDSKYIIASFHGEFCKICLNTREITNIPFEAHVELPLGPRLRFSSKIEDSPTFNARRIRDVSFSPDGRRIAFSAVNRVWVAEYPDGRPSRLTNVDREGEGEFQPVWSNDGEWIAFVTHDDETGGHIYKVPSGGAARGNPIRLTEERALFQDPEWSLDDAVIVAVRGRAVDNLLTRRSAQFAWLRQPVSEIISLPSHGGAVTPIIEASSLGSPHFVEGKDRIFAVSRRGELVSFDWEGGSLETHVTVSRFRQSVPSQDNAPAVPSLENRGGNRILASRDGTHILVYFRRQIFKIEIDLDRQVHIQLNPADEAVELLSTDRILTSSFGWRPNGGTPYWVVANTVFLHSQDGRPHSHTINVEVNSALPEGQILLQGARVITMSGNEVYETADILIESNRIAAIGVDLSARASVDATIFDVAGKTIMPGMIDVHTHSWVNDEAQQPPQFLANLAYGVTTMHEVGSAGDGALGVADKIQAGIIIGPRFFQYASVPYAGQSSSYSSMRNALEHSRIRGQTTTKTWAETQTRVVRQWNLMAARELGLMITTHRGNEYDRTITNIMDGYTGLEHVIPIAPIYEDVLNLMAATGVTYTPTLVSTANGPSGESYFFNYESPANDEKLRRFTPEARFNMFTRGGASRWMDEMPWIALEEYAHIARDAEFIARLVAAGGRAGLGGHGNLQGLSTHWELWLMASGGLSNHDALRVATIFGAEAIGFGDEIGSLEPGKLADLVILNENPLDDIRNTNTIAYVMVNGRLYDGDTLDEIWPEQRELPSFSWQSDPPPNADLDLEDRWPLSQH